MKPFYKAVNEAHKKMNEVLVDHLVNLYKTSSNPKSESHIYLLTLSCSILESTCRLMAEIDKNGEDYVNPDEAFMRYVDAIWMAVKKNYQPIEE